MSTISQSRGGGLGWLLIGVALAAVLVVANAPLPAAPMAVSAPLAVVVADADPLESGEPMAAEAVGETSIGPRAGGTYNIPGLGDVIAGQHAEDRHGVEALQARLAMQSGGYQRHDCKDGRSRLLKQLTATLFAVVVLDGNVEVSAFLGEHDADFYERRLQRDGCLPPGNPFGGMGALAN